MDCPGTVHSVGCRARPCPACVLPSRSRRADHPARAAPLHPTPHTVTAPDRFRRALAATRITRVAVTRYELEAGACGVAVPVFGPGGDVLAAIELTVRDLGTTPCSPSSWC